MEKLNVGFFNLKAKTLNGGPWPLLRSQDPLEVRGAELAWGVCTRGILQTQSKRSGIGRHGMLPVISTFLFKCSKTAFRVSTYSQTW